MVIENRTEKGDANQTGQIVGKLPDVLTQSRARFLFLGSPRRSECFLLNIVILESFSHLMTKESLECIKSCFNETSYFRE